MAPKSFRAFRYWDTYFQNYTLIWDIFPPVQYPVYHQNDGSLIVFLRPLVSAVLRVRRRVDRILSYLREPQFCFRVSRNEIFLVVYHTEYISHCRYILSFIKVGLTKLCFTKSAGRFHISDQTTRFPSAIKYICLEWANV